MLCARHGHVKQAHLVLVQRQAPVNGFEAEIVGYLYPFPLQPLGTVHGRGEIVVLAVLGRMGCRMPALARGHVNSRYAGGQASYKPQYREETAECSGVV